MNISPHVQVTASTEPSPNAVSASPSATAAVTLDTPASAALLLQMQIRGPDAEKWFFRRERTNPEIGEKECIKTPTGGAGALKKWESLFVILRVALAGCRKNRKPRAAARVGDQCAVRACKPKGQERGQNESPGKSPRFSSMPPSPARCPLTSCTCYFRRPVHVLQLLSINYDANANRYSTDFFSTVFCCCSPKDCTTAFQPRRGGFIRRRARWDVTLPDEVHHRWCEVGGVNCCPGDGLRRVAARFGIHTRSGVERPKRFVKP